MAEARGDNARCPRCGAAHHCGAKEACGCAQVRLDEATRAALRQCFEGCLCLACLNVLQTERDSDMA